MICLLVSRGLTRDLAFHCCVLGKSKGKRNRGLSLWLVWNLSWVGEAVGMQAWASASRGVQNICKNTASVVASGSQGDPPHTQFGSLLGQLRAPHVEERASEAVCLGSC